MRSICFFLNCSIDKVVKYENRSGRWNKPKNGTVHISAVFSVGELFQFNLSMKES